MQQSSQFHYRSSAGWLLPRLLSDWTWRTDREGRSTTSIGHAANAWPGRRFGRNDTHSEQVGDLSPALL